LRADRIDAAVDHIVDGRRIDPGAVQQEPDRMRAEIGWPRPGAAALLRILIYPK
jgi:hypothetical protein